MPYSRTAELPQAVRHALPPRAQRVFMVAFNGAQKRGLSEEKSFKSAWGAVRNAGWKRGENGKWVKKAGPDRADVHVDGVMDSHGKPKKKPDEDDDEDEQKKALGTFVVEVAKLDEDQHLVFGWLSVIENEGATVVDLQGHVIDEATLEAAAYSMVINGCHAGEMHERIGIGAGLIECMMFTKAKQQALGIDLGKVGLWVGFKVDAAAFAKVKSGELRAFSLGGFGVLEDMAEAA